MLKITVMQKDCAVLYACACLPSYGGICLVLNVLACPAMHLCVLLGKKARLHLTFSLAKAKILPSLLDVCLKESPEIIPTLKKKKNVVFRNLHFSDKANVV